MTIYDILDKLKKAATSKEAQRAVAELRFAFEISKAKNGVYDQYVIPAANALYQAYEWQGVITKTDAGVCENQLMPLADEAKTYKLHCVAHAHIDMNWMFGYNETIAVTLETFRTMLKLMKEYPDFTFSQSQISVYRIVEEYDADMFEQIKRRIAQGRWEISATTWVESDKNMPNGESLIRHYLYSKKYLREKFGLGEESMLLDFEPDTFGHNANMPEIMGQAGVKYYYHCRGYNGHIIYRWRSPSGAETLVYREPTWYNGGIAADMFENVPFLAEQTGTHDLLKVYGVGDHGGGPTRRDISMLLDIAKWPIAPTIVFSSYHRYFKAIESHRDTFPVVDGELNFVFTGCFSSQSKIKMANRIAEDRLYQAESLTALAGVYAGGGNYNTEYEQAWHRVLFNQFHDILPGSGIADTREYAMGLFQQAMGYVHSGTVKALTAFAEKIDTSGIDSDIDLSDELAEGAGTGYCADMNSGYKYQAAGRNGGNTRIFHLFNTTAYARKGLAEITVWDWQSDVDRIQFRNSRGKLLSHQILDKGHYWGHNFIKLVVECDIPSFGYQTVILSCKSYDKLVISQNKDPRVAYYPVHVLENNMIRAEFDHINMTLVSLIDKRTGNQLIKKGACCFNYQICSAMGGMPSAWNSGVIGKNQDLNCIYQVSVTRRELGMDKLTQWIEYTIKFENSRIDVRAQLDNDSTFLRYAINCDWHERSMSEDKIPTLRFAVPVGYQAHSYRYEIPFGTIERKDVYDDVCSRGFVCAINNELPQGIIVMTNSLYGYRGAEDCMTVTLIRASRDPDPCPEYGMHHFELGVGVCDSDENAQYAMTAEFLNSIQVITNRTHKGSLPLEYSLLSVSGGVKVSALKLPESGIRGVVIRLYNSKPDIAGAVLRFAVAVKSASLMDGLENVTASLIPEGNTIHLTVDPYAVQSVFAEF